MGNDHAPVEEKGTVLVVRDELQRLVGKQVVGVHQGLGRIAAASVPDVRDLVRQRHPPLVGQRKSGKWLCAMRLVQVAEEMVEALPARQPRLGRPDIAEPPLADQRRGVSGVVQDLGHGHILGAERLGKRVLLAGVAADAGMAVMLAGHQHAA